MVNLEDMRAIIVDASGAELTRNEIELFQSLKPAGFILFQRNCVSKSQVKELVQSMRECVGCDDAPILIDQEGGSVARLKAPEFNEYPTAQHFADIAVEGSLDEAINTTRLSFASMAQDLAELGVNVNCAPVIDVAAPDCHEFLSESRTFGADADVVTCLGRATCEGLLSNNVTPIIKHIPGHGRAKVDSHKDLPIVDATLDELITSDFYPFTNIAKSPMGESVWAMAAHVVYSVIDNKNPATLSKTVVEDIIRKQIGFNGVLLADDISMKALSGSIADKVKQTIDAGMDLTMICNAPFEDREVALNATPKLTEDAIKRMRLCEDKRVIGEV